MSPAKIKFGTDGWRGIIAQDFTFENVRRVAQATADYWHKHAGAGSLAVMVGYDNRFLSETFARIVCEVMAGNGIKALYPPTSVPTPAVSYAVRNRQLAGAVMITASHNPPTFNGYKLKAEFAGSAEPEMCAEIELLLDQPAVKSVPFDAGIAAGMVEICDPRQAHVAAAKKIVNLPEIRNSRLRVVVDSMHGSGGTLLADVLMGKRCRVTSIRADRNPLFGGINPEPIGPNLAALCREVKKQKAHVGLATDGDADRLGVVDDCGRYVSIQLVFAMLLLHLLRNRGARTGLVVKSSNSTFLIDRICRAYGLKWTEVPVGFKWVCAQMRQHDVLIGGEESGGIGFQGHIPERDGIVANLMLLELLAVTGKTCSELTADLQREFGRSAYDRIDMHYPLEKRALLIETLRGDPPAKLLDSPLAAMKDFDGVKYIAEDDSWLMFRASGTEPIIRIYSESSAPRRVAALLDHGRRLVQKIARS
jgi:alpha-D-glucose phosphate-specific phosphoglucomutase